VEAQRLVKTLEDLAETPGEDLDIDTLMRTLVDRCAELSDVVEAALVLEGPDPESRLAVSSGERSTLVRLVQSDEGPARECLDTGHPVSEGLSQMQQRWPGVASQGLAEGLHSVVALPMRLRGQVIGTLVLFGSSKTDQINPAAVLMAQTMADMATIAVLQTVLARSRSQVNEQLQTALDSRVKIEQAKGMVSERLGVGMKQAFELLRHQARSTHRLLLDVADEIVSRDQRT
jgi:GAF domain-containing protein